MKESKIVRLRVLLDTEQDVFRDLEIRMEDTFEQFHHSILQAFGWKNDQMASFYLSNDNWDKGKEIPLTDMEEEFGPRKMKTMAEIPLAHEIMRKNQKLIYVFDFFLMWCFFVEVVDIRDAEEGEEYPLLVYSYGDAPNQTSKKNEVNFKGDVPVQISRDKPFHSLNDLNPN